VRLTPRVQTELANKLAHGSCLARTCKKARILQLLGAGHSIAEAAKALGVCGNTVRSVEARFIADGVAAAINDKERPGAKRLLDARSEASLVAMVCTRPPEGLSRWSMSVIALECVHRKIVPSISVATVCRVLHRHALKPWREKNVVCSRA
jgi:transposase